MTVESKNVTASGTDVVYSTDGTDKSYQLIISGLSTENGDTFYELEIAAVLYIKTSVGYKYFRIDSVTYQQVYDINVANGLI